MLEQQAGSQPSADPASDNGSGSSSISAAAAAAAVSTTLAEVLENPAAALGLSAEQLAASRDDKRALVEAEGKIGAVQRVWLQPTSCSHSTDCDAAQELRRTKRLLAKYRGQFGGVHACFACIASAARD